MVTDRRKQRSPRKEIYNIESIHAGDKMDIIHADRKDIPELYSLQLLSFESEAAMIGDRSVPALMETLEEYEDAFKHWITLKLITGDGEIVGAIRYREADGVVDVGRLMVHPGYRRQGLARQLLAEVDRRYPDTRKELYTCTKSWINIKLYESMGYQPYREHRENSGLSFVYMYKE